MEKHTIRYSNKLIEFELYRKNVKNINLRVKPNMSVVVSANSKVSIDQILKFVKSKAPWILKNINHFKNISPKQSVKKKYISGETFRYLGKQYRLKLEDIDNKESVKYYQGYIYLYTKDKSNYQHKEKLINNWYKSKAEEKFKDSLNKMYPIIEKYGIKKPKLKIRKMKARWGSCIINKNTIILNLELIKAPKHCIDYVVLHELIHFKYRNHNNDFYSFLTSLMPDWKQRKKILNEVAREYLLDRF
ncbi:MAG: M48 family metallopeptidase [Eubacteriales bacterium]